MREILFRGKDLYSDKWIYGFFNKTEENIAYISWQKAGFSFHNDIVKSKTVGQYTGLKDENGKRIFEGDIFPITDGDGWEVGHHIAKMDIDDETLMIDERCIGVIIGNIHDNPELLEKIK